MIAALPIHSLKELAINGHDLMETFKMKPGKWLKDVLEQCEKAVILRQIENSKSVLLDYAKSYLEENQ